MSEVRSPRRNRIVGSGTTTIAAEQIGRRRHAMEIAPGHVRVANERWGALTGRESERIGG